MYLSGVFFPLGTAVDTRVKKKETGCMLMVRKGACVVLQVTGRRV